MNRKTKNVLKWIVIGLILGSLTLITLVVLLLVLVLFGGPSYRTDNIRNYQKIYEKNIHSGLIIFPEQITEDMSDVEFDFFYKDTWDDPTVSIFLQCTYTPEAYEAEVERLEDTKKVYGGTMRKLLYEEGGNYPYPAYIAVDNHHYQYEYALLSGEQEITYIYTSFFDRDTVRFEQSYLPQNYDYEQENVFTGGYSIYLKQMSLDSSSYDYTRDEYVTVTDGHHVWIEDSLFTVRVQLDDRNREIITECEFSYYEPRKGVDDYDWESDDTVFADLTGYEYRDLKLNDDRTTAIVTYLDGTEEKQWEMELTQYMKPGDEQ